MRRIGEEIGEPVGVVATGGLASVFAEEIPLIDRVDPDLTLWGLRLVYKRNSNK